MSREAPKKYEVRKYIAKHRNNICIGRMNEKKPQQQQLTAKEEKKRYIRSRGECKHNTGTKRVAHTHIGDGKQCIRHHQNKPTSGKKYISTWIIKDCTIFLIEQLSRDVVKKGLLRNEVGQKKKEREINS